MRGSLIVVVEDEPDLRVLAARWLASEGWDVECVQAAEHALEVLSRTIPSVVCLDLDLPGMSGLEALERIQQTHPKLPVVILTSNAEVPTVVRAMQMGAYDYLVKPVDRAKLCTVVRNAAERQRMQLQIDQLAREAGGGGYDEILGNSPAMRSMFRTLDAVAGSDVSVLIMGESGTGKELVARAVHRRSGRADAPFVAVNCAAIPETLQESELFGHERGAFTSANQRHEGFFEQADGGLLFLDEIAELAPGAQAKLLRVLQQRSFRRVGGSTDLRSDFRLVAATHRDLSEEVSAGRFREDLYFRVAVFELELPSLRVRGGDVELLARAFLRRFAGERQVAISAPAQELLNAYPWPGNVRELMNAVQRALVVCGDTVEPNDLPKRVRTPARIGEGTLTAMEELERRALQDALSVSNGNISEVVRKLGLGRTTVYRKMKKYGLR